jgi:hypothetical protein
MQVASDLSSCISIPAENFKARWLRQRWRGTFLSAGFSGIASAWEWLSEPSTG